MPALPVKPEWLRSMSLGAPVKVDRENGIIYGRVAAELGDFKDKRGSFNARSLASIAEKINANPKGVKARFTHPTLSGDGLGKFLGRDTNARVDGRLVRTDLRFDPTAYKTPHGDLANYTMDLAESDAGAFGSSLVILPERIKQLDDKGRQKLDAEGEPLPDIWLAKDIRALDVVDDGDAVHGDFMSAGSISFDDLPDFEVRKGSAMLDQLFAGQPREVVDARCRAWLERYLNARYGESPSRPGLSVDLLKRRLRLRGRG